MTQSPKDFETDKQVEIEMEGFARMTVEDDGHMDLPLESGILNMHGWKQTALDETAIRKRNHYYNAMIAHDEPLEVLGRSGLLERAYAKDQWRLFARKVEFLESEYLGSKVRNHLESVHLS